MQGKLFFVPFNSFQVLSASKVISKAIFNEFESPCAEDLNKLEHTQTSNNLFRPYLEDM